MIERIEHGGQIFAIVIRASFRADGIAFFTPDEFSQQLGYMNRPKGHVIDPHVHNPVHREIQYTNEVLFIKSGKIRVDFYRDDHSYFSSLIVSTGDVILLVSGGHGFEMLEQSEMIEVKQGPYAGDGDKTRIDQVAPQKISVRS